MLGTLLPCSIGPQEHLPTACCVDPTRGEVPPAYRAMGPFILCNKQHHVSSPDRLECYVCHNIHQRTAQAGTGHPTWFPYSSYLG